MNTNTSDKKKAKIFMITKLSNGKYDVTIKGKDFTIDPEDLKAIELIKRQLEKGLIYSKEDNTNDR